MRVLISGGSRGIGRSCVGRFCRDGHHVVFLYRSSQTEAEALMKQTGACGICCDVSDSRAVREAVQLALNHMGGIDVLINNAGIAHFKLFTELSDE